MNTAARIATLALFALCVPGLATAEVSEILKAHFKAVGGLDKLSDLRTVTREGSLRLSGNFGAFDGTTETAIVVGKKAYTHNDFGVGAETTGYNGETGWKDSAQGLVDLSGDDLAFARAGIFLDPLQDIYEQYGAAAFTESGDKTIDGKECVLLNVVGAPLAFALDKESHHVVELMIESALTIHFGDYAGYGGVMLPNTATYDIQNLAISIDITYEKTDVDVELDEAMFEKP